jgi:hypothetical protein
MLTSLFALALGADLVENRFILVDQSDWGAQKGFYIDIENKGADPSLPIDRARLILGVGDGWNWRYIVAPAAFRIGQEVRVQAKISSSQAVLSIDGTQVGTSSGAFASSDRDLLLAQRPSWASAPASYRIDLGRCLVQQGLTSASADPEPASSQALALFEDPMPKRLTFHVVQGEVLTIDTSFRISADTAPSIKGLVDAYGQAVAASWPGKVQRDADLKRSAVLEGKRIEGWHRPSDWDPYGGLRSAPWHEKKTGFYRIVKHGQVWWMVSPAGNPLFYTGLCTSPALRWEMTPVDGREEMFQALPPKTGATADLWAATSPWGDGPGNYFAPQAWNMLKKFGADWTKKATEEFKRRIDAWAFCGQGKWSDGVAQGVPRVPVLSLDAKRIVRHPDVFDEAVREQLKKSLAKQIGPLRNDPLVVGFSIGNEFDEIVTTDEVKTILQSHADSPAAKAIRRAVTDLSGDAQIEKARQFYAQAYYGYLYRTVKELDPNHLYFGFWIVPGWWQNNSDWDLIAPYCDAIGYDRYAHTYSGLENLLARHDKPVLLGEFSHPAWYGGRRGYGRYEASFVEADRDSGRNYAEWLSAASKDPKCIGALWFQYRDEPLTGRGPGKGAKAAIGEHYAFGFVDVTDQPKWDLITQAREANLRATRDRLATGSP